MPLQTAMSATRQPHHFLWRYTFGLFSPTPTTLLSPGADVFMAGGASLILFVLLTVLIPKEADVALWGFALYYVSFLVNSPHFAASYQLLYHDAGKDFFSFKKNPRFSAKLWWAGCIVPLLMIGYFFTALQTGSMAMMTYSIHVMYFLVGWHYIKQIFGCVIVLSAQKKVFFHRYERWIILSALYSLWLVKFFAANLGNALAKFFGIPYAALNFPPELIIPLVYFFVISALGMLLMFVWRHKIGKPLPPLSAVCAIISIYVWLTPVSRHAYFEMIIPFFHSLQYLLFVVAYKRNQSIIETKEIVKEQTGVATNMTMITTLGTILFLLIPVLLIVGSISYGGDEYFETMMTFTFGMIIAVSATLWSRTIAIVIGICAVLIAMQFIAKKSPMWHFAQFIVHMLLIGALILSVIPTMFDILSKNNLLPSAFIYNSQLFGTGLYLFIFSVFINIHHYFIDNVLWRRDNPNVREFLFAHPH